MRRKLIGCTLVAMSLALALTTPVQAERLLLSSEVVKAKKTPSGGIFDACGIAFRSGQIYVSDYYHHAIEAFDALTGEYKSQLPFPTDSGPVSSPPPLPKPST